jgi:hypothetical protein
MRLRLPCEDWGREWEEWVDEEETELDRECCGCTGMKSRGMLADIICILTAAMVDCGRGEMVVICERIVGLLVGETGQPNENKKNWAKGA